MVRGAGPVSSRADNGPLKPELTNVVFKRVGEGIFELGKVQIDQNRRTVSFPASVNMNEGLLEYLLVNNGGKIHESFLRTETEPYHIHVAALLLQGPPKTNQPSTGKRLPRLTGDKAAIWLEWAAAGKTNRVRPEETVWNMLTKAKMKRTDWIYNGSRVVDGSFFAQAEGSIIAIIGDEAALMNNLLPERENDKIWLVNTNVAPAVETPVTVTIQFEQHEKKP